MQGRAIKQHVARLPCGSAFSLSCCGKRDGAYCRCADSKWGLVVLQTSSDKMVDSITSSLIEMMHLCNDALGAPSSKL